MDNVIFVNCCKTPFSNNLGVSNFLFKLLPELVHKYKLIFIGSKKEDIENAPQKDIIQQIVYDVIDIKQAKSKAPLINRSGVELLPHHFQESCLSGISIAICHDLHIFDIPWKYPDLQKRKIQFRKNLKNASAVITEFPRTYYMVESIAGVTLKNLFLTESPLIMNTTKSIASQVAASEKRLNDRTTLIFPAQLQKHKNHEVLIHSLSKLSKELPNVDMLFPGTDFDHAFTAHLKELVKISNLCDRVKFLGRLSDDELIALYHTCDAVIVPSLAEGGAYVPMEAIVAEKSVAVNFIESAYMHLKTVGANVHWFNANSVESTIGAIQYLSDSNNRYNIVNSNHKARNHIADMSWKSVADKWFSVIDYLSGKIPRPFMKINGTASEIELS